MGDGTRAQRKADTCEGPLATASLSRWGTRPKEACDSPGAHSELSRQRGQLGSSGGGRAGQEPGLSSHTAPGSNPGSAPTRAPVYASFPAWQHLPPRRGTLAPVLGIGPPLPPSHWFQEALSQPHPWIHSASRHQPHPGAVTGPGHHRPSTGRQPPRARCRWISHVDNERGLGPLSQLLERAVGSQEAQSCGDTHAQPPGCWA